MFLEVKNLKKYYGEGENRNEVLKGLNFTIDEGQIVGMGTHKELLQNCKVYQEIAYSQLSKEELESA